MRILKSNYFLLLCFLLVGGFLSAYLRYETMWDFANYHYFNPWAFLNGRVGYDIGVAALSAFFNPLIDIPLYGMIQIWNDYPTLISFMQGLWFGALLFVFSKILLLFFDFKTIQGKISVVLSLLIGSTGWATFMQIGTSSNEILLALLVLISFYMLLKEIFFNKSGKWYIFFFAGFVLGSAVGLKPTSFVSCLAIGFTILIFYKEIINFKKNIPLFILGGLIGFLVFNGFWMYILWDKYQNPFFPFLNKIFQSEYLPNESFFDTAFIPKSLSDFIFYPFKIFEYKMGVNEGLAIDYRLIAFSFIVLGAVFALAKHKFCSLDKKKVFLFSYLLIFYLIWLSCFAIKRYYVAFEMLLSIFVLQAFWYLFPRKDWLQNIYMSLGVIFLYMLLSTPHYSADWGMMKAYEDPFVAEGSAFKKRNSPVGYGKYVNVEQNFTLPKEFLLLTYNLPTGFLLPVLNEKSNARGIVVKQETSVTVDNAGRSISVFDQNKWQLERNEILATNKLPMIAIITKSFVSKFDFKNDKYLKDMVCRDLKTNIDLIDWKICVPTELEYMIFGNKESSNE